ncbi:MAG TPA: hypothetical protein VK558_02080 [Patescibacteria group bacterium]|nr:hypothetical protein [Patescibacteria group bacterium]
MNDDGRPRGDKVKADEKQQRLAEALRANLRRRKSQARARADYAPPAEGGNAEGNGETGGGEPSAL